MKIGLAQLNTIVGDLSGNAKKVLEAYQECLGKQAELVVTPELVITGYPPRDLVYKSQFLQDVQTTLEALAQHVGEVPLMVGYVGKNPTSSGAPFSNSVAMLCEGKIKQTFTKCLLPTYDVFDEARYFQPAEEVGWFQYKGKKIGVTICEDIWREDYLPNKLYVKDPPLVLAEAGCQIILNLSASPFHAGKQVVRERMLRDVATSTECDLVYCNAVGGNDQLVFDGNSFVMSANGYTFRSLPAFEEKIAVVDLEGGFPDTELEYPEEEEEIYHALVLGVRDYLTKCGFSTAVIGLSGGIDSALTAAVACEALGPENVLGITMPTEFSSEGSVADSLALANNLGMRCEQIPIQEIFEAVKTTLNPLFDGLAEDVTEENMQARIRGLLLMSVSNKMGHLLLTTGNKSELAVGYCTIYGDMCGGLAVISDVPKTKVFNISRWLNESSGTEIIPWATIEKPPSAELRHEQKDEDSLPPYEMLDEILELYVEGSLCVKDIVRCGYDEETVIWVARHVDLNEWKRQQAAPGIRVTSKAFGMGRRIPIVQRYRSA